MTNLLALASYVYQSAAAVGLIFAIGHLLPSAEYTSFSLTLASGQLLCVFMFEWLQLAGVRFLAAARGDDAARLRGSLFAAGALSTAALVLLGSVASFASPIAAELVALGLAAAVLQGLTDLYFMVVRVSDRLGTAALLLIVRASLLLGGAVLGALLHPTAGAALVGLVAGHAVALGAGLLAHRPAVQRAPRQAMLADWAAFCRYGMLAAGASVIHLAVPVTLRFIVVSGLQANPAATAGFSMALDLLQRPFAMLITAIHTVNYPEVVVQFEHGTRKDARQATARLIDFLLCATVVMLGGLLGFLPDAARLFVPSDILDSFLGVAPAASVFYFLHVQLQTTVAVIPHLTKSAVRLVIVAAGQWASVALFAATAAALYQSATAVIAGASIATAAAILFAGGPTLRFGASPRWLLISAAMVTALLIGSLSVAPSTPTLWLVGKIAMSASAVALIAWRGEFLLPTRRAEHQAE